MLRPRWWSGLGGWDFVNVKRKINKQELGNPRELNFNLIYNRCF